MYFTPQRYLLGGLFSCWFEQFSHNFRFVKQFRFPFYFIADFSWLFIHLEVIKAYLVRLFVFYNFPFLLTIQMDGNDFVTQSSSGGGIPNGTLSALLPSPNDSSSSVQGGSAPEVDGVVSVFEVIESVVNVSVGIVGLIGAVVVVLVYTWRHNPTPSELIITALRWARDSGFCGFYRICIFSTIAFFHPPSPPPSLLAPYLRLRFSYTRSHPLLINGPPSGQSTLILSKGTMQINDEGSVRAKKCHSWSKLSKNSCFRMFFFQKFDCQCQKLLFWLFTSKICQQHKIRFL